MVAHSSPFSEWPPGASEHIVGLVRSKANFVWIGLAGQMKTVARRTLGTASARRLRGYERLSLSAQPTFGRRQPDMQRLFRLAVEPRRVFCRCLIYKSLFVYQTTMDRLLGRRRVNSPTEK